MQCSLFAAVTQTINRCSISMSLDSLLHSAVGLNGDDLKFIFVGGKVRMTHEMCHFLFFVDAPRSLRPCTPEAQVSPKPRSPARVDSSLLSFHPSSVPIASSLFSLGRSWEDDQLLEHRHSSRRALQQAHPTCEHRPGALSLGRVPARFHKCSDRGHRIGRWRW